MSLLGLGPVLLGLGAAVSWGASDFAGGLATRQVARWPGSSAYTVVIGGQLAGLLVLFLLVALTGEVLPPGWVWVEAGVAGLAGGLGLSMLYRALAGDQMSLAAPVSAVVGAAVPVGASLFLEGWPELLTAGGLLLALVAIWMIAQGEGAGANGRLAWSRLRLPLMAGLIFGVFFILLHNASQESLLWPVVITRLTSVSLLTILALAQRQARLPGRPTWLLILVAGLLDTAGNALFVLAGQAGRLDIAAVLSSLYPGGTVLLAWLVLKERLSTRQLAGILAALAAIILITV